MTIMMCTIMTVIMVMLVLVVLLLLLGSRSCRYRHVVGP
jgi:hypothetical protein